MKLPEAIKKYERIYLPLTIDPPHWYLKQPMEYGEEKWAAYRMDDNSRIRAGAHRAHWVPLTMEEFMSDEWEEYHQPTSLKHQVIAKLERFRDLFEVCSNPEDGVDQLIKEIEMLDWENKNETT